MGVIKHLAILVLIVAGIEGTKIDPSLKHALQSKGSANVFVSFTEGTANVLNSFNRLNFNTRADRLTSLKHSLEKHANAVQAQVIHTLKSKFPIVKFQTFWISNQIYIRGASLDLVLSVAKLPSVASIAEETETEIMMPVIESVDASGRGPNAEEWGVSLIQAPEAWGLDGGNNGENVLIATIDTGVRVTHEALKDNFVGDFGWFDPYEFTASPNDQNGHGTHVTGTIAGQGGIGVAPGAKWMACKGCASFFCAQHALLSCGQFIACPTDTDGNNADCSKAPHLVSNSWGGGQGRPVYHDMIEAWIAADIVPVFANGNSGPSCGSANSPADHPGVIGVGSTTSQDELSSFSSVGPSFYGTIKPDVSAPGSSVRSSYNSGDSSYAVLSGTSMACPHAAGVVALLKGRDQEIGIETVRRHLFSGISREVTPTGRDCGGISEDTWPNNAFGHGRVNALKALVSFLDEISS